MSDEWFIAICWSSLLFGTFAIKMGVVFSWTSFGALKYDLVIKVREIFIFLLLINLINNSTTINPLFTEGGGGWGSAEPQAVSFFK